MYDSTTAGDSGITLKMRQHGVGHGGFHTQRIKHRNQSINVIYDCGSRNSKSQALKNSILSFIKELHSDNASIELLVLSHFDFDHINGLEILSQACAVYNVQVKNIWIPLLDELEKMLVYIAQPQRVQVNEWYHQLLLNPDETLNRSFPEARIRPIHAINPEENLDSYLEEFNYQESISDREWKLSAEHSNGRTSMMRVAAKNSISSRKDLLWEFIPYRSNHVKKVIRCTCPGLCFKCQFFTLPELVNIRQNNKPLFKEIEKAVKLAFKGIKGVNPTRTGSNLMSMCLYTGPVGRLEVINSDVDIPKNYIRHVSDHYINGPYPTCVCCLKQLQRNSTRHSNNLTPCWLGTGDFHFIHGDLVQELVNYFGYSRIDKITIVSAPHHGSKHDSSRDFWHEFPNLKLVTFEASHSRGMTGRSHPHYEVLNDVLRETGAFSSYINPLVFCTMESTFTVITRFR